MGKKEIPKGDSVDAVTCSMGMRGRVMMPESLEKMCREEEMSYEEKMEFVRDNIGEAAMYEQLAEECAELAKAALKKSRILRGDNPTPVTLKEADAGVCEEYTDVADCADLIGIKRDPGQSDSKMNRWIGRIVEKMPREGKETDS